MSQLYSEEHMSLRQFFGRSLGKWESHRNYMYGNGNCTNSITIFDWTYNKDKGFYVVSWDNEAMKSDGSMGIRIASDFTLERSNGYFTVDPTTSSVITCSRDHLRTKTSYGGATYDEEINFANDSRRIRRTIATKDSTQQVFLIGTYVEKKLD